MSDMTKLSLPGRMLFLSSDPDIVEAQLRRHNVDLSGDVPLRHEISTDEITPLPTMVHFDEEIGRFSHIGFKAGDRFPIGKDALKEGGFSVLVAGRRYGKGSSREHGPFAELSAGIRLVIAESFERIYRQNCDNLGLFTSTDLGLVERIQAGESISVEELVADREPLAARILSEGGLLRFGERYLKDLTPEELADDGEPRTLVEKIIRRHLLAVSGIDWEGVPGTGGFIRARYRFIHEMYTAMGRYFLHRHYGTPLKLHEPDSILCFEDHNSYAHRSPTHIRGNLLPGVRRQSEGHRLFARENNLVDHGYLDGEEGSEGIAHAMMAERYAVPGEILVGTDSHTPHSGALGCLAFGVGTTDIINSFMTGAVRMTAPQSLLVRLEGALPVGVTAKDAVLHLLAMPSMREGGGLAKAIEFAGPVIDAMSIDERATLTNMTAEMGGFTGIVAPDEETVRFLKERRGIDFEIEPWMRSDPAAGFADVITVDCSELTPMLAAPGDPGNGVALGDAQTPTRIDIAYGGSCTAGKRADFDYYHDVLSWAAGRGLKVADGVKLYLQFGTTDVRDYCREKGYLDAFEQVGAEILNPACGACAHCGPGVSSSADEVTISAINRNFPGRSGPGQVWLASPPTVAASAIAGAFVSFADLKERFDGGAPSLRKDNAEPTPAAS
jgi:3-isopropylmalate/(R)-2-methylmalate dehydratase large subunit